MWVVIYENGHQDCSIDMKTLSLSLSLCKNVVRWFSSYMRTDGLIDFNRHSARMWMLLERQIVMPQLQ